MKNKNKKYKNKNIKIAEEIIKVLKTTPLEQWQRGWDPTKGGVCKNAKTNLVYRGLNFLRLYAEKVKKGYEDNRWITFKQASELGGSVKSGQKATELSFYSEWDNKTHSYFNPNVLKDMSEQEAKEYKIKNVKTVLKSFWVFNVEQCENLKLAKQEETIPEVLKQKSNTACEKIIKDSEAKISYDGISDAYYISDDDTIHLPEKKTFNSIQDFYATALHEISHSTGAKNRLNRDLSGKFGSESYAQEELIAELSSVMLQNQAGIVIEGKHLTNHASYIKNWLDNTKLNNQPFALIKAVNQADKSAKYIVDNILHKKEQTKNIQQQQKIR